MGPVLDFKAGKLRPGTQRDFSNPPLSSLLKPPYPGQSWAGCWVPELSLTLPDPQGLCFQSSNQNPSLHPAHIRPGPPLAPGGHQHFFQRSQDTGYLCLVMSHLLILTAVKSLLCHLPHTATPHSTQPLPSLCLTWFLPLVSTPGCRLGHTLTRSPLRSDLCTAPCCPQSPSRGPPGLCTTWPHSPQHSTPTATHGSAISRMCSF